MIAVLTSFLTPVLLAGVAVLVSTWIYRLTYHPLSRFPGPKLAAISQLYAMSFDLPRATSYIKNFAQWHQHYGPIIRIEPNHLHVLDMDAYNQVFRMGSKFNKDPSLYGSPFSRGSFFNKLTHMDAKPHRDMYQSYFSRQSVQALEPVIKEHVLSFLTRVEEADANSSTIDLTRGFRCLTADSIMRYCYDKPYGALASPEFKHPMLENIEGFFDVAPIGWYFPNLIASIIDLVRNLPLSCIQASRPLAAAMTCLNGCTERIVQIRREIDTGGQSSGPSIFRTAFAPRIEKGQPKLSNDDLAADAMVFFIAGTDSTANTLVTGTWGLLNRPDTMQALKNELREAIPYSTNLSDIMRLDWQALEQLYVLRSVVKEALRLAYGIPGKIPRVVPPEGATFCNQFIPGGTIVSMSCYVYHHHPPYFPAKSSSSSKIDHSTDEFHPSRWLEKTEADSLEKYFIPFSRGTMNCLGSNLAYAQLYYTFAYLFRCFELEAFETDDKDMAWHDAFVIKTFGHLKVKARRAMR